MKTIILTGAHFTPAQAVIEQLKKQSGIKLVYVGRKTTREGDKSLSVESQVLPKLGVKFIPVITGRLQRSFTIYTIPSLIKIPIGLLQSLFIIFREKPDVILSFGGYVSVPIVLAGWIFSIPIILHEQTLVTGLASKISEKFADKIAVSFERDNSHKIVLTGNPVRQEIIDYKNVDLPSEYNLLVKTAKKEKLPIILVTGGNQGSHIINLTIEKALKDLTKKACVIHQTGDSKYKDWERLSMVSSGRYLVKKWIGEEMGLVISISNLVVSRAGANTLLELAFMGKPTLVIPIPYLYKDEQNKNAKYFAQLGLVKILPQADLSASSLVKKVREMLKDLPNLEQKAQGAKSTVIENAAENLANLTLSYLRD